LINVWTLGANASFLGISSFLPTELVVETVALGDPVRRARIAQRAGRRQRLPRLKERLQPGEDHRPAAVEFVAGALPQLVVHDRQPAGIADRFDLPRDARGRLRLHTVAPKGVEALHEPARRVDLEILILGDRDRTR